MIYCIISCIMKDIIVDAVLYSGIEKVRKEIARCWIMINKSKQRILTNDEIIEDRSDFTLCR